MPLYIAFLARDQPSYKYKAMLSGNKLCIIVFDKLKRPVKGIKRCLHLRPQVGKFAMRFKKRYIKVNQIVK